MPASIGLYIYKFDLYRFGRSEKIAFDDDGLKLSPLQAVHQFVSTHKAPSIDEKDQRIWFFQDPIEESEGEIDGYINYGTYGFESDFIDTKTKETKYKRETHHYEDIPLFYQIWIPEGKDYGLMLFQSFSGRSCSQKVRHAFTSFFMNANEGTNVRYKKLMPSEIEGEASMLAPVTGLSFIKRRTSADRFDDYGQEDVPEEVDIEVHVHARKKGSWGPFGKLDEAALRKEASGLYLADAEQFDRAIASVKIGKKTRRFPVFGPKGEAGSIDVTEDVEFLSTGHPETHSLQKICNEIMSEFSQSL